MVFAVVPSVVIYLLDVAGGRVVGLKRVQKLIFLALYTRIEGDYLELDPVDRSVLREFRYVIHRYGPSSAPVYRAVVKELPSKGFVDAVRGEVCWEFRLNVDELLCREVEEFLERSCPGLPERIRRISSRFIHFNPDKLTVISLRVLGLTDFTKELYRGFSVDELIDRLRQVRGVVDAVFVELAPQLNEVGRVIEGVFGRDFSYSGERRRKLREELDRYLMKGEKELDM